MILANRFEKERGENVEERVIRTNPPARNEKRSEKNLIVPQEQHAVRCQSLHTPAQLCLSTTRDYLLYSGNQHNTKPWRDVAPPSLTSHQLLRLRRLQDLSRPPQAHP